MKGFCANLITYFAHLCSTYPVLVFWSLEKRPRQLSSNIVDKHSVVPTTHATSYSKSESLHSQCCEPWPSLNQT